MPFCFVSRDHALAFTEYVVFAVLNFGNFCSMNYTDMCVTNH
jgi:hypothetical protein